MGESFYLDFDLILERAGEKFRARVFDSPAGQASAGFDTPFSALELENFVLRMGKPRTGVRRIDSLEMDAAKKCGERLFRAVFTDDVYACFLRSRDSALELGKGLRVRLHIDVPEFHDYPWELLYNAHLNQFLALSKETPVVRYLELPYPVQPLTVQPPLKILAMISSPAGFPQLNLEEEWRRLSSALAPLMRRGLVNLERVRQPTLSALQQHLRRGEYHIFHFIGHGKFSEHKQDGMLLLEEEDGRGRPVSGPYLGAVLHDHRSLRLVVLNACEGARTSREDPYAGVAQTLVLQGIPAVIAMQFEIAETAAITFAQEFYGAVADGFPVDAAVSEARKAIFAAGNDVEWGTPVLYMRTPQGVIFEIPQAHPAVLPSMEEQVSYVDRELEQKLEQLYTEGLAAFWVEDWDKACDRFQKILNDHPDHVAAAGKLGEAQRQRHLSALYARAVDANRAEDWTGALNTLEELLKDSSDYKDAAAMLKAVKKQKQLAELYAEAKQLQAAMKWQAVARVFAQIKSIDPNYPDPEALLPTAERKLEELKRQTELNDLYSHALREMEAGRWGDAVTLLRQIRETEPGFLETERLLSKVEAEIRQSEEEQKRRNQIGTLYEQAHGLLRSRKWRKALDKLEEIHRLDEQFEDPDRLAVQAQDELVREEKEAELQNELAAMYAEAVRLLRAGKYREALEKWQEIRAMDPGYPDRQSVERTARKSLAGHKESVREEQKAERQEKLAAMYAETVKLVRAENYREALEKWQEIRAIDPRYPDRRLVERSAQKGLAALAKPATRRPRMIVPKSLWIALGGIVAVVAVAILVMNLSGKTGVKPPSATRASTVAPTVRAAVAPTSFATPVARNTVRPPAATQITGAYADPTLYDDFNRSSLDLSRWTSDRGAGSVAVQEGSLRLKSTIVHAVKAEARISEPYYVESRFQTAPHGGLQVYVWFQNGQALCQTYDVNSRMHLFCKVFIGDKENIVSDQPVPQDSWNTTRIEIEPSPLRFNFYVNGLPVGSYATSTTNSEMGFGLGNWYEDGSSFDYVRVGALADDPTLYDSFNGKFDSDRWQYSERSPKGEAAQQEGALVFTQGGVNQTTTLAARRYQSFRISESIFIEASLKIDLTSNGFVTINTWSDVDGGTASFGLHSMSDIVVAHCWDRSERSIRGEYGVGVGHGSWHVFRLEVDVDENEVRCYINGRQLSVDSYQHPLRAGHIWVTIGSSAGQNRVEATRPVKGYIDYLRIGPLR